MNDNSKHNYAQRKYAQYKTIQSNKAQPSNIAGVYNYNSKKGELTPFTMTYNPAKEFGVYAIRLGSAINQNYLFINFTNFQSIRVTYEINEENEYSFTYNNFDYIFNTTPTEKKVRIEIKK
jgi:hypothetical protein